MDVRQDVRGIHGLEDAAPVDDAPCTGLHIGVDIGKGINLLVARRPAADADQYIHRSNDDFEISNLQRGIDLQKADAKFGRKPRGVQYIPRLSNRVPLIIDHKRLDDHRIANLAADTGDLGQVRTVIRDPRRIRLVHEEETRHRIRTGAGDLIGIAVAYLSMVSIYGSQ